MISRSKVQIKYPEGSPLSHKPHFLEYGNGLKNDFVYGAAASSQSREVVCFVHMSRAEQPLFAITGVELIGKCVG